MRSDKVWERYWRCCLSDSDYSSSVANFHRRVIMSYAGYYNLLNQGVFSHQTSPTNIQYDILVENTGRILCRILFVCPYSPPRCRKGSGWSMMNRRWVDLQKERCECDQRLRQRRRNHLAWWRELHWQRDVAGWLYTWRMGHSRLSRDQCWNYEGPGRAPPLQLAPPLIGEKKQAPGGGLCPPNRPATQWNQSHKSRGGTTLKYG